MAQEHGLDALQDLAERLVSETWPFVGDGTRARLFVGAIPPQLPFSLAVPPSSQIIGSAVRAGTSTADATSSGERIDIVLDAAGTSAEILDWFDRTLIGQGWSAAPARPPLLRGFQDTPLPESRTYCSGEREPWLSIVVRQTARGLSAVRIYANTTDPGPCSSQRATPHGLPAIASLMPALTSPSGVTWSPTGGGSEDRWTSEAIAETRLSAAELEAAVASQLTVTNWRRQDGRAEGPVAWSRWRVGEGPDYEGFLFVRELADAGQCWIYCHILSLHMQVRRGAPGGWMQRSGWVGS